jgi:hypothetical protein
MRRTAATLSAITLTLAGALAVATPAQAAVLACPYNRFCLYSQQYEAGARAVFLPGTVTSLTGWAMNDNAESAVNNLNHTVMLIGNRSCTPPAGGGYAYWIDGGKSVLRFPAAASDRISCVWA